MEKETPKLGAEDRCRKVLVDMQYELYAYILSLVGEEDAAEDIAQNTCLHALQLAHDDPALIDGVRDFRAWLRKAAYFQVMTWRNLRRREKLLFDEDLVAKADEALADRVPAADDRMTALESCLKKLPASLRSLVNERYQVSGCVQKMATARQTTPHAITMNLYRARKMLKDCIVNTLSGKEESCDGRDL